jgi:hypothetical protein
MSSTPSRHRVHQECERDFTPYCTSKLQPLDLGVTCSLNAKYRKILVRKAIATTETKTELKLNTLLAMHMALAVWNSLSSSTVRNCFRKAVLPNYEDSKECNEEVGVEDWRKLISNPMIKLSDFVNGDATAMTTAAMAIEGLCQ